MMSVLSLPAVLLLLIVGGGGFFMTLGSSSANFTQFIIYYVPALAIAVALKIALVTFFWQNRLPRSAMVSLVSTLTFAIVSGCALPLLYTVDILLDNSSLLIGISVLVPTAALIGLLSEWIVAFFFKNEYPQHLRLVIILLISDLLPFIAFDICWIIYFAAAANFPAIQM